MKKIKELNCIISDGNYSSKYPTKDEFVNFGIPFIRANNIKNHTIIEKDMYYISPNKHSELKKGHLKKGDVLIVTRGSIGLTAIVPDIYDDANINAQIVLIRCDNKTIFNKYLLWNLNSKRVKYQIKTLETGSTLKQLPISSVNKIDIVDRNYAEQEKIAKELDKISEAIENRKLILQDLDMVTTSRFYELFGNFEKNEKNFKVKKLKDICKNLDKLRAPITEGEREKGVTPYYGASGIVDYVNGYIFDDKLLLISEDGANLVLRTKPIAFSIEGRSWVNNHAHVLKFSDFALQKYVEKLINLCDVSKYVTGSAQPKLNQARLNDILIPIPEGGLLNIFKEFVDKITRQKELIEQDIKDLESLLESKMHEYFD